MLTAVRQTIRRAWASTGRRLAAPAAVALHRRPGGQLQTPTVHMLVSSRTWDAGLLAAVCFEHHTGRRWRFFIHEDGTVGEPARRRILSVLPDATLVSREESDARAVEFLAAYPRCLAERSRHNLFLKFSDFAAFCPGDRFIVLDSDVIFFRRPPEVLDWVDSSSVACRYNEDTKEKFCIPRGHIEKEMGVTMWPRFNSGLILLPKAAVSLDLAERFIATFQDSAHHPQFFEQTLYGLMGSVWNRGGALPPSYEINWGYFRRPGAVCRHYVGAFKHDLLYIEGAPLALFSKVKSRLLGLS